MTFVPSTVTVVVSIDGLAPRHINRATMPNLTTLARSGASCFTARTVSPTTTRPAHTAMFCGVAPADHELRDDTPRPVATDAPSFLQQAQDAGLRTATFVIWLPLDGNYWPADDLATTNAACALLDRGEHDLVFVAINQPDVDGHEFGWDSPECVAAASRSDTFLGQLLQHIAPEGRVIVTTDQIGPGSSHRTDRPEDFETFVVVRDTGRVAPATGWPAASILDIAPTVAALCGFAPAAQWSATSLIGHEVSLVDTLLTLMGETQRESYGENVNMLDHALQSASRARDEGASDDLILAVLLHDLGHILGDAGQWGLAGHAEVGARFLQPLLSPAITEPIRLHVAAKRYRVAVEPSYLDRLSHASVMSLAEQGGPFSADDVQQFEASPFASEALRLRAFDDDGKVSGLEIPDLASYRALVESALTPQTPTSAA